MWESVGEAAQLARRLLAEIDVAVNLSVERALPIDDVPQWT